MAMPRQPADSHDTPPPRQTRPRPPLNVKIELVVVDGDGGSTSGNHPTIHTGTRLADNAIAKSTGLAGRNSSG
jgi:hypothetical protein